jgi:hypothetical protein
MNPRFSHKHKFRHKAGKCPGRETLYRLWLVSETFGHYCCSKCGLSVINKRFDRDSIKSNPCIEVIVRKIHES